MFRSPLPLALAMAALASALGGCERDARDAATTPAAVEPAPAAMPPDSTAAGTGSPLPPSAPTATTPSLDVTAVDVGSAVGADNRVTTAASTFGRNDAIYVSVATDGAGTHVPVTAKWIDQDGQIVNTETRTVEHAGPAVTAFRVSRPEGWPAGDYQVQVSVGDRVVQTRDFAVR
jgi:hypothetical protein